MQLYRDRKNLLRPFLSGVTLSYVAIDNIVNGPLRDYLSNYFDLKEFGTNVREEYLYYLILFLGIFELVIALQSLFLPVIEIAETKIVLRSKGRILSVIEDINVLQDINLRDDNHIEFIFPDKKTHTVNIEDVSTNDLEILLKALKPREK
tara:strand:+ start:434 stop:883 length:450 start_codon:yes stop_codon:yes gene_type:complete